MHLHLYQVDGIYHSLPNLKPKDVSGASDNPTYPTRNRAKHDHRRQSLSIVQRKYRI
jgi:hypothetical protein